MTFTPAFARSHYRAFVGRPGDYDLLGGLQFSLLFTLGLRDHHSLADIGCGSLRAGRLFIPYLLPHNYVGVEPEQWLVQKGLDNEVGQSVVAIKRPTFVYRDDFDLAFLDRQFDWILAQSIFSHTYEDLARLALRRVRAVLAPTGFLVLTVVTRQGSARGPRAGEGWLYPGYVGYRWKEFQGLLKSEGLVGVRLSWPHPEQQWVLAGRAGEEGALRAAARRAHWSRRRTQTALRQPSAGRYWLLRSLPPPVVGALQKMRSGREAAPSGGPERSKVSHWRGGEAATGRVRRSDRVLHERVEGCAVLVEPGGAEIIKLNPVGTMVWDSLDGKRDVHALADVIAGRFTGLPMARLEEDVVAFLDELGSLGLVELA